MDFGDHAGVVLKVRLVLQLGQGKVRAVEQPEQKRPPVATHARRIYLTERAELSLTSCVRAREREREKEERDRKSSAYYVNTGMRVGLGMFPELALSWTRQHHYSYSKSGSARPRPDIPSDDCFSEKSWSNISID